MPDLRNIVDTVAWMMMITNRFSTMQVPDSYNYDME